MDREVKALKTKGKSFIVTIENEDLTVSETMVLDYRLVKGKILTEKEYLKIKENLDFDKIYQKTLHYAHYQLRSKSEIMRYLNKYSIDNQIKQLIIEKLEKSKVIDDNRFLETYIYEYSNFRKIGPRKIITELLKKGIDESSIMNQLKNYPIKLIKENIDYHIEKKIKQLKSKPFNKSIQLIKTYLMQKGFSIEDINERLDLVKGMLSDIDERPFIKNELKNIKETYMRKQVKTVFHQYALQKLIAKGFQYTLILEVLEGDFNDENQ